MNEYEVRVTRQALEHTYVYAIIAACRAGKVKGADLLLR